MLGLLWLLILVPIAVAFLLAYQKRPTVAEVHSWLDQGDYQMLLVLNGQEHVLRAGAHLDDPDPETVQELARAMILMLARRVQFTPRTVYIPEGPMGLNAYPN